MNQPDWVRPSRLQTLLIWAVLAITIAVPVVAATRSPLLQWRDPIYVIAGFAGIASMAVMVIQPLLAAIALPGLSQQRSRSVHRVLGIAIVVAVCIHIGGLWVTSPPDVIDVLLLRSPTPFAVWGFAAMSAVFAAALLARVRGHLPLRLWRWGHTVLVVIVVVGTVVHALQITGTMEVVTKTTLSAGVIGALGFAIVRRKVWMMGLRAR